MRLNIPNTARLTHNGTAYKFQTSDESMITWEDLEHADRVLEISHEDMLALIDTPNATLESNYFAKGRIDENLSDFPEKIINKVLWMECWVKEALARIQEGSMARTEPSLKHNIPDMESLVQSRWRQLEFCGRTQQTGQIYESDLKPSASALYRWIKDYEKGGYSAIALVPKTAQNKGSGPRFTSTEEALISRCLGEYLSTSRPKMPQVAKNTRTTFQRINRERLERGKKPLRVPSTRTLTRRIGKLEKYHVHCKRYGTASANKKFALFDGGISVLSPGERIEIDEWRIDLVSLMVASGVNLNLTPEEKKKLERERRWMCAIIDCATRCILGFVICETPTSRDALRALELVARDKTEIAQVYECESAWDQRCGFGTIVADNGSAFISKQFCTAVTDLRSTIRFPPAGVPSLRGTIERVFRTYAYQLMPYLTGRTFSNVQEREDYPSERLAALTDHDLTKACMNFIIDVYHNEPHGGLNGETPTNCWKRLVNERGVRTPPDVFERTTVFGHTHTRKLNGKGILLHNIDYGSDALRKLFQKHGNIELEARLNPHDLGWIAVKIDGVWQEAKAIQEGVDGLTLIDWMTLDQKRRSLFASQAELARPTRERAIARIKKTNSDAMARMAVEPYDITEAQFRQAEAQSYWGVRPSEDDTDIDPDKKLGLFDQVISPIKTDLSEQDDDTTDEPSDAPTPKPHPKRNGPIRKPDSGIWEED